MNHRQRIIYAACLMVAPLFYQAAADAQLDTVERVGGGRPVRGQVVQVSPTAVVVQSGGSNQTVDVADIRKVNFGEAKGVAKQAITQFYSGSYNDCLDSIERNTEKPTNKYVVAELDYCKAMSMASEAIAGGNITLKAAGSELAGFLGKHGDSFHFVPASQAYAKLCQAIGRFDIAKEYLNKVLETKWGSQQILAHIELGKIALIEKDFDAAAKHFDEAIKIDSGEKSIAQLKQIARCRKAQASAMKGDPSESIKTIEAIIKNESSEDKALFSNAYNALGHCQLKAGNKKSALLAFLHTQMLFTGQTDTQSEALFELFRLWNQLNYPDRARDAQKELGSSFRNTYYGNPDIKRNE